jgi:DNA-binding transcriptional LysR family regulator
MLELDLLRVFVAVVDRAGITRAAAALHRTQSGVSMQIKRLEDAVGVRLFHREGRQMRLTHDGDRLLSYARRLLLLSEEALATMAPAVGLTGAVRLGCIDDYATRVVPDLLAGFLHANPAISIEVSTGLTGHLLKGLGRDYDLVLTMHPADRCEPSVMLRHDTVVWARGATEAWPNQAPVLPLALYPEGCLFRRWMTEALDAQAWRWRCAYLSQSTAAVEAAVRSGLAVSAFKSATIAPDLLPLGVEDGFPAFPQVAIALHCAPRLSKAAEALACCLTEALAVR